MTNITFIGDWHGETQDALRAIRHAHQQFSTTLLHAGDFGIWSQPATDRFLDALQEELQNNNQMLYFVQGNHENFPLLYSYPINPTTGTRPLRPNIHHLPQAYKGYIDRFTGELLPNPSAHSEDDLSILALGGAVSVDKRWRKPGLSWWAEEEVTREDIDTAVSRGPADILLMHDSPAPAPNPHTDDPMKQILATQYYGVAAISAATKHRHSLTPVLHAAKPKLLVHGHYHTFFTALYRQPNSDIITNVVSLDHGEAAPDRHILTIDVKDGL